MTDRAAIDCGAAAEAARTARSADAQAAGRTSDRAGRSGALAVRVVADLEALRSLEAQHHALFASALAPHIGSAFPYVVADAATGASHDPWRLVTVFRDGVLVGCLYGRRVERTVLRMRMTVFQLGPQFVADPLVDPVDGETIAYRLVDALLDDQGDCAMFVFPRLSSTGYQALEQAANRLRLRREWRWAQYAYRFDTTLTTEAFVAGQDPKARREIERRERRLETDHGYRFLREEGLGADADMDRFEAFMALEDSGWKGRNESSIRRRPGYEPYFRELVTSATRGGLLNWYSLRSADRPIAMNLCLRSRDTLWTAKIGYDERFASYGIGKLLEQRVMMDCLANPAIRQLDNLSAAPWVQIWNPLQSPFRSITLYGRSPRARLVQRALQANGLARRVLGRAAALPGPGDRPFL